MWYCFFYCRLWKETEWCSCLWSPGLCSASGQHRLRSSPPSVRLNTQLVGLHLVHWSSFRTLSYILPIHISSDIEASIFLLLAFYCFVKAGGDSMETMPGCTFTAWMAPQGATAARWKGRELNKGAACKGSVYKLAQGPAYHGADRLRGLWNS